ncbi:hypothetical protein PoB_003982500 [Plakobranchus ocellatus]|uniref:Uncharacterized protein n=1 Tax=Plakobranchus ocellatus TaxID=259542 RepID=A0AAV4B2M6_9GAST|nr:hypothetical protein PoB_003982500 [Plakobranchus ocellatus]
MVRRFMSPEMLEERRETLGLKCNKGAVSHTILAVLLSHPEHPDHDQTINIMQLISAFIAATALFASVLGAEEFCDPQSFTADTFDAINFGPVKTTYNANIRAFLMKNVGATSEFTLLDFANGRVYITAEDGSCTYYENDDVKSFGGVPPAGLVPTVTIPGSEPLSSFDIPVGVVDFKTWQLDSGDDCELVFLALYVNDSPALAYVFDDNDDADQTDLQGVQDALTQVQAAGCTQMSY